MAEHLRSAVDNAYETLRRESHGLLALAGRVCDALRSLPAQAWVAVAVILVVARIPVWLAHWRERRASRHVVPFSWPVPPEAAPGWTGDIIASPDIFAHERDPSLLGDSSAAQHVTCYDPSTGTHIATMALCTAAGVRDQVAAADAAQPGWARSSFAQRKSLLRSIKAWIMSDMEGIVNVACRDTGKTRVDAVFGEVLTTLAKIDWLLQYGEKALAPERRANSLLLAHKVSTVKYVPLGTVLALVSWNYSFHNVLSPILAALFAGDAIVVKCSEQVAWSSAWFVGGVKAALHASGWNDDIVQLVVCLPDVAETLTRNPTIKHITFIGSEPVGRKVAAAAAEMMIPSTIELGGKDPAFILPSADLDFFASTWMRGAFQSAGQNCIGVELFLVPRKMQDRFLEIMTPRVQALRPGVDVGSLISHTPIRRLERALTLAAERGARIIVGGKEFAHPDRPEGAYFAPTLVADVRMDMAVATEELFAPIMTVVPYDTVDEALQWLKNSRFGLGAGVYGRDRAECIRVADATTCGMVALNDFGVFYLNQDMPFGGTKASGHGRFAGPEGLRGLCYPKAVIEDRFFRTVRTSIPRPVDFPLPPGDAPWTFLRGLVRFAYGQGVDRAKGLADVVRVAATTK